MKIRLPGFAYELIPVLYVICGLCTAFLLESVIAVLSGILLISAGITVWIHRYNYRKILTYNKTRTVVLQSQENESGDLLIRLRWRKSYESGHSIIDEQHKKIFLIGSELASKSIKSLDSESIVEIQLLFGNMVKHIAEHFKTEESVLSEINHPIYEKHKKLHLSLLSKCEVLSRRLLKGQLPTREILEFIICDLIADHLRKDDMVFFGSLKKENWSPVESD